MDIYSKNVRVPHHEIADKLNVTSETVRLRIKQLENKEIIVGYKINLDLQKLGYQGYRVDFLLKQGQIVLEIKKTRKGLDKKKLGEELIIDIARYKTHPDCKSLICFAYDRRADMKLTSEIFALLRYSHPGGTLLIRAQD